MRSGSGALSMRGTNLIVRFSYNSSLAHLCRRLIGKLIVYQSLLRPSVGPSSAHQHFQTSLKPLGQFNSNSYGDSLGRGNKVCSNGPGHMTKMAATPIYGKNPLKIFFSRTRIPMTLGLGMKHCGCSAYQVYSNNDPTL